MNTEYVIPITLTLHMKDAVISVCLRVIKIEGQPYVLLQLEPLMN